MPVEAPPAAPRLAANLVLFSVLATGMGQSMSFALLAPLGREVGFGEIRIGLIITCSSLLFTIASPIWGRTCDRWGRRPVLLVGQFGYALGALLFATVFFAGLHGMLSGAPLYGLAIFSRVLLASLMSAAPSAAAAYIADTTSAAQRTGGMGRLGAARTLGAILGPALGGALAGFGLLAPLYCAAGIALVSALLLAAVVREPPRRAASRKGRARLKLFDRRYFPFIVVGFGTFLAFSMMSQTIGFYFQDRFHLDGPATAQVLGLGLMVAAITSLLAQAFLVQRLGLSPPRLLTRGLPLLFAGFGALPFAGSIPLLIGAMGVIGLGLGLVGPGFTAGASLAVGAEEQGAVGGLISACPAAGFVLGPLVGTGLYQLAPTLPYIASALLVLPLFGYAARIRLQPHREAEDQQREG